MVEIPETTLSFQWDSTKSMGWTAGVVGDFPEADWIRLDLTSGRTYDFYTGVVGAESYPYLELYDSAGNKIAQSDVAIVSHLSYTATFDGVAYVKAHYEFGGYYDIFATTLQGGGYVSTDWIPGISATYYGRGPRIFGLDGNDKIWLGSSHEAHGGGGNDKIVGNAGNDRITGGYGNDSLYGNGGNDVIWGGHGDDRIWGNEGDDEIFGGFGNDTVQGGSGNDRILDLDGQNVLHGGDGADFITGSGKLYGDDGNDVLVGSQGKDTLVGGNGNDRLEGDAGADRLTGGAGADLFIFKANDSTSAITGRDTIVDFGQADGDRIELRYMDADTGTAGNQAFHFIGTSAFSHHAGELRYKTQSGNVYVYGDVDGDGRADFSVQINGLTTIDASAFYL